MAFSGYKFTKRERVLLVVLIVAALGVLWYFAVYNPCQDRLAKAQSKQASVQTDIDAATVKKTKMTKMQNEIAKAQQAASSSSELPAYDNVVNLTNELNSVLSAANTYSLKFDNVETSGNIVRRKVTLDYTAATYDDAKSILNKISDGRYRCMLGDMSINDSKSGQSTSTSSNAIALNSSSSNSSAGRFSVNVSLTFYESKSS